MAMGADPGPWCPTCEPGATPPATSDLLWWLHDPASLRLISTMVGPVPSCPRGLWAEQLGSSSTV